MHFPVNDAVKVTNINVWKKFLFFSSLQLCLAPTFFKRLRAFKLIDNIVANRNFVESITYLFYKMNSFNNSFNFFVILSNLHYVICIFNTFSLEKLKPIDFVVYIILQNPKK